MKPYFYQSQLKTHPIEAINQSNYNDLNTLIIIGNSMAIEIQEEIQSLKIIIQKLEQNQEQTTALLTDMSHSLRDLVKLQKDHDVLRIECFNKIEANSQAILRAHQRVDKIDSAQTWFTRLVFSVITVCVLAAVGLSR